MEYRDRGNAGFTDEMAGEKRDGEIEIGKWTGKDWDEKRGLTEKIG